MTWHRIDAATGMIVKGKGKTADGKGYNPYRAAGKFATGPHKEKEKAGRGRTAPAEGTAGKPKRGAAVANNKKPAANEKTKRVKDAKAAVAKAKEKPTAENIKTARDAVGRARGKSGHDQLTATGDGHVAERPSVPEHGIERIRHAEASPPQRGQLIDAIGNGGIRTAEGRLTGLNEAAQLEVRNHFNEIAASAGMTRNYGDGDHTLHSRSSEDMGRADGLRYSDGKIEINNKNMAYLGYHAQDLAFDPKSANANGINAYQVMMHETVHSHGPDMPFVPSDRQHTSHLQLAEEMSTEMSARRLTAAKHDIKIHEHGFTGYGDIMNEAIGHVSSAIGISHADAAAALGHSALDFKSQRGTTTPSDALRYLASGAVRRSGMVGGEEMVSDLHQRFLSLASEMQKRYPWP